MKCNAFLRLAAAMWILLATSGCGSPRTDSPEYAQYGLNKKPDRYSDKDRSYPNVLSVSPTVVRLTDLNAGQQHFYVNYSVANASALQKLQIELYVPGIGTLGTVDVGAPGDDGEHQAVFWWPEQTAVSSDEPESIVVSPDRKGPQITVPFLEDGAFRPQIAYRSVDLRSAQYLEIKLVAYSLHGPAMNFGRVAFTE